jgi:hypothetical protein
VSYFFCNDDVFIGRSGCVTNIVPINTLFQNNIRIFKSISDRFNIFTCNLDRQKNVWNLSWRVTFNSWQQNLLKLQQKHFMKKKKRGVERNLTRDLICSKEWWVTLSLPALAHTSNLGPQIAALVKPCLINQSSIYGCHCILKRNVVSIQRKLTQRVCLRFSDNFRKKIIPLAPYSKIVSLNAISIFTQSTKWIDHLFIHSWVDKTTTLQWNRHLQMPVEKGLLETTAHNSHQYDALSTSHPLEQNFPFQSKTNCNFQWLKSKTKW